MKLTITYQIDKGTAINPKTKTREPILEVSREYDYNGTINSDSDEISWLFFRNHDGLTADYTDEFILEELRFFLESADFDNAPTIIYGRDYDKYEIDLDRWHEEKEG